MIVEKGIQDWDIFQYRFEFWPDIPDMRCRKSLIAKEKPQIGGNCFDGTMLYKAKRLEAEEIVTKLPNTDDVIQIKFRFTGIMHRTDPRFLRIYNTILKRVMSKLNRLQVGRDEVNQRDKRRFSVIPDPPRPVRETPTLSYVNKLI